jgi:hypothetical protein
MPLDVNAACGGVAILDACFGRLKKEPHMGVYSHNYVKRISQVECFLFFLIHDHYLNSVIPARRTRSIVIKIQ